MEPLSSYKQLHLAEASSQQQEEQKQEERREEFLESLLLCQAAKNAVISFYLL